MKKTVAILLLLASVLTVLLTACSDPLKEKQDQLTEIYNKLGDTYYLLVEAVNYHYDSNITDKSVKDQLTKWKKEIKSAKNAYQSYDLLEEIELDDYIYQWSDLLARMEKMYAEYKDEVEAAKTELESYKN